MQIFVDNKYVVMTKDRKCILRGSKTGGYILTTISEDSKSKICTFRQTKKRFDRSTTKITEAVRKLYNNVCVTIMYYDKNIIPELEYVEVECVYKIPD